MLKKIMKNGSNEEIIRQKERLAENALRVADASLEILESQLGQCSARDLVTVFNSAVKVHRDIVSDIVSLSQTESKQEQSLAKEYGPTVGALLKKIDPNS